MSRDTGPALTISRPNGSVAQHPVDPETLLDVIERLCVVVPSDATWVVQESAS